MNFQPRLSSDGFPLEIQSTSRQKPSYLVCDGSTVAYSLDNHFWGLVGGCPEIYSATFDEIVARPPARVSCSNDLRIRRTKFSFKKWGKRKIFRIRRLRNYFPSSNGSDRNIQKKSSRVDVESFTSLLQLFALWFVSLVFILIIFFVFWTQPHNSKCVSALSNIFKKRWFLSQSQLHSFIFVVVIWELWF